MVVEGLTEVAVPLVTVRLPGVMTPVPPEKVPVRLVLEPVVMVAALAVKLEIAGGGLVLPGLPPPQPVSVTIPSPKTAAAAATKPLSPMASSN